MIKKDLFAFKIQIKLIIRLIKDLVNRDFFKFSQKQKTSIAFDHKISISQAFLPSNSLENKIHNIKIAAEKINKIIIKPDEIFSFWRIIGNPNRKNGFKKGRNIISEKLKEDYGGGLCQLSGIMYHISLVSILKIIERHNHTVDLYSNEARYTPLGADATVVYAYKDLRVQNTFNFPIKFNVIVKEDSLFIELLSQSKIIERNLTFNAIHKNNIIEVDTLNEENKVIAKSVYKKNQN